MAEFKLDASILTVFVLATCLTCLWMVFFFGRRLQTSAYLRDSLIEGVKQQELRLLLRELHDRRLEGPLDPKFPPPPDYGSLRRLWESNQLGSVEVSPWPRSTETEDEKRERLEEKAREQDRRQREIDWENEERGRYQVLRQQLEKQAYEQAQKKVPATLDISLLGGGWAFLLEFSTIIVIIFTLLILGISKSLEGKDIATILAAIAGYVLGKATSPTKQPERTTGEFQTKID